MRRGLELDAYGRMLQALGRVHKRLPRNWAGGKPVFHTKRGAVLRFLGMFFRGGTWKV